MRYYPAFVDLQGRKCVVIGAGEAAPAKVSGFLEAGATVHWIAPDADPARLGNLPFGDSLLISRRPYAHGDLAGARLAIYAELDAPPADLVLEAEERNVLLNVLDRPSVCGFVAPAITRRGELTIAVSTGGASPAFAQQVRRQLDRAFGDEYAETLVVLRRLRRLCDDLELPLPVRRERLRRLAASPLCRYLRDRRLEDVDRLLAEAFGPDTNLASLGIALTRNDQ